MTTSEFENRFWSHVDRTEGCWLWTASLRRNGYGQLKAEGRNRSAHRVAWELANGAIPDGRVVDHLCRVRHCVRPDHLRLVTHKQNCEHLSPVGRGLSGVRGVTWDASRGAWAARLGHDGRTINLGRFPTVGEAALVVRAARRQHFTHSDPEGMTA